MMGPLFLLLAATAAVTLTAADPSMPELDEFRNLALGNDEDRSSSLCQTNVCSAPVIHYRGKVCGKHGHGRSAVAEEEEDRHRHRGRGHHGRRWFCWWKTITTTCNCNGTNSNLPFRQALTCNRLCTGFRGLCAFQNVTNAFNSFFINVAGCFNASTNGTSLSANSLQFLTGIAPTVLSGLQTLVCRLTRLSRVTILSVVRTTPALINVFRVLGSISSAVAALGTPISTSFFGVINAIASNTFAADINAFITALAAFATGGAVTTANTALASAGSAVATLVSNVGTSFQTFINTTLLTSTNATIVTLGNCLRPLVAGLCTTVGTILNNATVTCP